MKTGRNDSCPCGSGKKYKHCCLGKDSGEAGSRPAQSIFDEIEEAAAASPFESLEELNAFTRELVEERNRAARAQFCGLSPEQMAHLIYQPFTSPDTVRFHVDADPRTNAEVMAIFLPLVEAIGDSGLKATARGNLPLKFCKAMAQQLQERVDDPRWRFIGGINSETDLGPLHCTRLVAGLAGLIRKYRGRFVLTRKCRDMLAGEKHGALYLALFEAYATRINWAYRDGFPEAPLVQHTFLYTLFLLASFGDRERPQQFYEDKFLTAFPMAIDGFEDTSYSTAESDLRRCYTVRALDRFAAFFGLAELVPEPGDRYARWYNVRKTALLDRFVNFALDTASLQAADRSVPGH